MADKTEKFYMVVSEEGKTIIARNAVTRDKADSAAKKAAFDYRQDFYILEPVAVAKAPLPNIEVVNL